MQAKEGLHATKNRKNQKDSRNLTYTNEETDRVTSLATPPRAPEAVRLLQPNAPQPLTLLRPFILGGLLPVGIEPPT